MTRISLVVISFVLMLAAAGGGHLVWGDNYNAAGDQIIWGNNMYRFQLALLALTIALAAVAARSSGATGSSGAR